MLAQCVNDHSTDIWDWDHPHIENLMEQMSCFFEVCLEFHQAYLELKIAVFSAGFDEEIFTTSEYGRDLQEMNWTEFPVAEQCDIPQLYDSIIEMLDWRMPLVGGHKIMHFLHMCIS